MSRIRPVCLETCLVSHKLRLVFAYVPKAACSSLKRWLIEQGAFGPELIALGGRPMHAALDQWHSLRRSPEAVAVLADPAYFKFTFVRHPLSRLVSAYLDKVVGAEHSARRLIRHAQFRAGHLGLAAARRWLAGRAWHDSERSLSFREFVQQLVREDRERVDTHFREQSRLLRGLPLDFLGRVENSRQDFRVIQERLGCPAPLPQQHTRGYTAHPESHCVADWPAADFRRLSGAPRWPAFFDPPLLALATDHFAADFEQFGYSRALAAAA